MEIGIYITANIIYLGWELCLGDRVVFLTAREASCQHTLRWMPFLSVLWPLAGDVRRITCSFIALALDIHVFSLRAEAEGAILYATKKVWGMRSELTFHVGRAKVCLWLRLCRKFALQNVGGSEWVRSQNRLCVWRCKDWHRLHEFSCCYFKVYEGTRNLNKPHGWTVRFYLRLWFRSCNMSLLTKDSLVQLHTILI